MVFTSIAPIFGQHTALGELIDAPPLEIEHTQEEIPNSSVAFERRIDTQKREKRFKPELKSRYSSKDFDYTENLKTKRGNKPPNDTVLAIVGFVFKILGLAVIVTIIFLILRAFIMDNGSFKGSRNKSTGLYEIIDENIDFENVDYMALASNASKLREFKLAVRYYFLAYLQRLNHNKIIDFHPDKSNREYRYEIQDRAERSEFDTLCRIFDYSWYGERELSELQFKSAESNFLRRMNKNSEKSVDNSGANVMLVFLILASVCSSCDEDKVVDWEKYYKTNKKTPYGLYVLSKELETITPGFLTVEKVDSDIHDYFSRRRVDVQYGFGTTRNATFLYIDDYAKMGSGSMRSVLDDFVYFGNQAFVSVNNMPADFLASVGLNVESDVVYTDKLIYSLVQSNEKFEMNRIKVMEYFEINNQDLVIPLGYVEIPGTNERHCNFLAYAHGDGLVYLHASPEMFTNYSFISMNNAAYVEGVFSYLYRNKILWFNNYNEDGNSGDYSLLSYIMSQPGLKAAWYMLWLILLLFALTKVKRTQRIIPILVRKKNFSVDYTQRMAQFHVLEKNFHGLIENEILLVLDKLRMEYRMDTTQIDDSFAEKMHKATNCNLYGALEFVRYLKKQKSRSIAFDFDFKELMNIVKKLNLK